jgi:hypothetical protein
MALCSRPRSARRIASRIDRRPASLRLCRQDPDPDDCRGRDRRAGSRRLVVELDAAAAEVVRSPLPACRGRSGAVALGLPEPDRKRDPLSLDEPLRVEIGLADGALYVRDNGRGIDPVDHQRVFELFDGEARPGRSTGSGSGSRSRGGSSRPTAASSGSNPSRSAAPPSSSRFPWSPERDPRFLRNRAAFHLVAASGAQTHDRIVPQHERRFR